MSFKGLLPFLISFIMLGGLFPVTYGKTFSDVPVQHANFNAITYLTEKGVLSGNAKTFSPKRTITRAEFMKILLLARFGKIETVSDLGTCFSDVTSKQWYAAVMCDAKQRGLLKGVDGKAFATKEISLAEASMLFARAFEFPMATQEGDAWYVASLKAIANKSLIPQTFYYVGQPVPRGAAAEMVWRALLGRTDVSVAFEDLALVACTPLADDLPKTVDMKKVRSAWLGWVNEVRGNAHKKAYIYDAQLHASAVKWSQYSRDIGKIEHKRPGTKAYYDYKAITAWFKNLGLVFKNVNGSTHTENIGWGYYACDKEDCTDTLISEIRSTFDFFMSEKKNNGVHYRSIMQDDFRIIGLGIALDEKSHRYYLTVHYGTEISSTPIPMCMR